jgi:4-amino-4-deoxy-L-arabinose transferase-like glycosyltransferase
MMKYLAGIGAQFADGFGPARALSAVWTALGCALLVPIGARLYNLRTGILAGTIAALLPPLVAHGQIVGHESPTVLWWTLGILLALSGRLFGTGVVIGLATASRFVNGLLGVLCLAIIAIEHREHLRRALWQLPALALATFYVVWPRLWLHPAGALAESLHKLSQTHSPEPFLGTLTAHPGPHYFIVYLLATLPVGVLVGLLAWPRRDRATLVTALWLVIPLVVAASPVRQDGVRYVMPSVVALALASAAGWERVASRFRVYPAVLAALALYLAITLVRIHPYYLDYFAEEIGGTGTVAAHGWFETAWWGEGVDRAVAYVNEHAAQGARVYRDCIEPAHLAWFRADLWNPMVRAPAQADWIVTYAPQSHRCPIPPGFDRVFTVGADGATLAEVWQRTR